MNYITFFTKIIYETFESRKEVNHIFLTKPRTTKTKLNNVIVTFAP